MFQDFEPEQEAFPNSLIYAEDHVANNLGVNDKSNVANYGSAESLGYGHGEIDWFSDEMPSNPYDSNEDSLSFQDDEV